MAFTDAGIRAAIDGHEVAGGNGWEPDLHPSDASIEVSTLSELKSALAGSHEIIAIANDAAIRVDEHMALNLRSKKLVSYRGWDGREGGLLYTTRAGTHSGRPFTMMYSDGTTSPEVHGLRIRGADHDRTTFRPARDAAGNTVYHKTLSRAIMLRGTGGRVSNCKIWGFAWNDVHIKGRSPRVTRAEVDHCDMSKSFQIGYGYSVDVWRGFGNIHHNYFNETRGPVDGFGFHDSGYDCHHNVFGPTTYRHSVDMHCLYENKAHTTVTNVSSPTWALRAGGKITIRDNQFCFVKNNRGGSVSGIGIRGVPMDSCKIERNAFMHPRRPPRNGMTGEAWRQSNVQSSSYGKITLDSRGFTPNFTDSNNEFGVTKLRLDKLGTFRSSQPNTQPSAPPAHEIDRNRAIARRLKEIERPLQTVRTALADVK